MMRNDKDHNKDNKDHNKDHNLGPPGSDEEQQGRLGTWVRSVILLIKLVLCLFIYNRDWCGTVAISISINQNQ